MLSSGQKKMTCGMYIMCLKCKTNVFDKFYYTYFYLNTLLGLLIYKNTNFPKMPDILRSVEYP